MSALDPSAVRELARLARLALSEEELATVAVEIERLRGYVARIQAVQLDEVATEADEEPSGLREDVVRPGLSVAEALAGAPETEAGHVALPKVLEDSGR